MILIKNKRAIAKMETAGRLLAKIFEGLDDVIAAGVSTERVNNWIEDQIRAKGLVSMMKGYRGYAHVSCISINDELVHAIPSPSRIIKVGDLVKVDVCVSFKGYGADMARCYFVEPVDYEVKNFVAVAWSALQKGIDKARAGNRVSDISAAIQAEVEHHGFGVVRTFAGHGIGRQMHEDPEILNYGRPGEGAVLRSGMTLALEPMITMGDHQVYIDDDNWTARTKDGSMTAHVEDTILVTEQNPKVLTRPQNVEEMTL